MIAIVHSAAVGIQGGTD